MRAVRSSSRFGLALGIEGFRSQFAVGFLEQDLDSAFGFFELLLAFARKSDAFLEKFHGVVERKLRASRRRTTSSRRPSDFSKSGFFAGSGFFRGVEFTQSGLVSLYAAVREQSKSVGERFANHSKARRRMETIAFVRCRDNS